MEEQEQNTTHADDNAQESEAQANTTAGSDAQLTYTEEQVQEKIDAEIDRVLGNVCAITELAAHKFTREAFDDAVAFVKKHC